MKGRRRPTGPHVAVEDEPFGVDFDGQAEESWRQCADVLYASRPRPQDRAARLAVWMLLRYPGCLIAVARRDDGGCTVATRRGGRLALTALPPVGSFQARGLSRALATLHRDLIAAAVRDRATRPERSVEPPGGVRRSN